MLDYRKNEIVIVENLKTYLKSMITACELVRQNQVAEVPKYPYGCYSVTTLVSANSSTYSIASDGTHYKNILQTWSFTFQSDDQEEAMALAMAAFDFFTTAGVTLLSDNKITVRRVGGISSRDNLVTMQYEYRNGLDVTFGLLYTVQNDSDVIESFDVGDAVVEKPLSLDELNELLEKRLDGV